MIEYIDADEACRILIASEWDEKAACSSGGGVRRLHRYPGSTPDFRRQGIARRLIEFSMERAEAEGMTQIRAWSSEDKTEALHLWKALGFGLCPATTYPNGQAIKGFFV